MSSKRAGAVPSKADELEILDRAIAELGPSSYLGPWLSQVRGEVVAYMGSDLFPTATLAEGREAAAVLVTRATEQAAGIVAKAEQDARVIREDTSKRLSLAAAAALNAGDTLSRAARG